MCSPSLYEQHACSTVRAYSVVSNSFCCRGLQSFRQEYWSGLPCPPPGDRPNPGTKPASPASSSLQADSLPLSHQGSFYRTLGKSFDHCKHVFFFKSIFAFELQCWRRLLRVSWTARRSNQSILKEINPEYSLEGLMLKLKLQYFGHLMGRTNSFEKTLMLGKIEGERRRG